MTVVGRVRARRADTGAAAVEFALVAIPLFTLLFGIIQYGFVFYQLQGASATVRDAATWASRGIVSCSTWRTDALDRAARNGIPADLAPTITADFRNHDVGGPSVLVTLEFSPLQLVPLVPVPDTITRTAEVDVEYTPHNGKRATGVVECA